eukprot:GILK01014951.1.p1 GENE.GILK01014951.1~~GILK01014951.1.p1  ORF type:complete len:926 (-),score=132.15 GILK01014951.1:44-2776(-)
MEQRQRIEQKKAEALAKLQRKLVDQNGASTTLPSSQSPYSQARSAPYPQQSLPHPLPPQPLSQPVPRPLPQPFAQPLPLSQSQPPSLPVRLHATGSPAAPPTPLQHRTAAIASSALSVLTSPSTFSPLTTSHPAVNKQSAIAEYAAAASQPPLKVTKLPVTLEVLNKHRFAAFVSHLFSSLPSFNSFCQSVAGSEQVTIDRSRCWSFPIERYEQVVTGLLQVSDLSITFAFLPPFVLKCLDVELQNPEIKQMHRIKKSRKPVAAAVADTPKPDTADLPEALQYSLMEFQKVGVTFGIEKNARVLIADEMGLGKTIQALAISYLYPSDWPVLIICPSSMRLTWVDEVRTWLSAVEEDDIHVILTGKQMPTKSDRVTIISYDLATRMAADLAKIKYNIIIADEAHYLKTAKSKRTQVITPLMQSAKRAILLTGTPALSRPVELFSQLHILRPDLFSTFKDFADRYCAPKPGFRGIDYTGASHTRELHALLDKTVMIRRLKKDVLTQLPSKRRQKVQVATEASVVKRIQVLLNRESDSENGPVTTQEESESWESKMSSNKLINECFVLTGRAKLPGITEYVEDLVTGGCKFLLFAHHIEVLDAVEQVVSRLKVGYIRVDGSTSQQQRHSGVERFQTDDNCKVAILALTAAGQGLTLTAASTVVFAEMHWTPGVMQQAEDRVHRIGQQRSVNIHYLFGKLTLDQTIWPKLQKKLEVVSSTLDGQTDRLTAEKVDGVGRYHVEPIKSLSQTSIPSEPAATLFDDLDMQLEDVLSTPPVSRSMNQIRSVPTQLSQNGHTATSSPLYLPPAPRRTKTSADRNMLKSRSYQLAQEGMQDLRSVFKKVQQTVQSEHIKIHTVEDTLETDDCELIDFNPTANQKELSVDALHEDATSETDEPAVKRRKLKRVIDDSEGTP